MPSMTPIEGKLFDHLNPMMDTVGWDLVIHARRGKYTADFLIDEEFVVECDGHTYHDSTDEQADHDRQRDRWFLRNGFTTIRFSSSEIFDNAEACATEIIRTIASIRSRRTQIEASPRESAEADGYQKRDLEIEEYGFCNMWDHDFDSIEVAAEEHW